MNAIKINDNVKITFSDGTSVDLQNVGQEELEFIVSNFGNEEILKKKYCPEDYRTDTLIERIKDSNILTLRGNNIYMLSVAPIAMPEDLAEKLLDAEEEEDEESLTKYTNFWKLVALNPDHRVRANLFWFIRKWGVTITEYGFLKCYRNVDIKKEVDYSPEEMRNIISNYYKAKYLDGVNPENIPYGKSNLAEVYHTITNEGIATVFTDAHSHTFTIKIGTPVSMPREEVDCEQEHSCSSGLHVGAKGWLKKCYFGEVGLEVLVNPANVCAVPTIDDYGKMRVCEYLPTAIVEYDSNGDVIENPYDTYKDLEYLKHIIYDGETNDVDVQFNISSNISREEIYKSIYDSYTDEL